jgi:hypothetical protein
VPDYAGIDPNSVHLSPDGHVSFSYLLNGQLVNVGGTLKNGTGVIYDQGRMAYFTYQNGKLTGTRFLDEGRAIATPEPLLTAVTTAVGVGPMFKAGLAGWAGLRGLFGAEVFDAGANMTATNVLTHCVEIAGARAEAAAHNLAIQGPGAWSTVNEAMSARAAAYQVQVTGHDIAQGYIVNGIKFDTFANGTLVDAKSYYSQFVSNGEFMPWFNGQAEFINQAQRQLAVAAGTPVQWVFAEPQTAAAVSNLLRNNNIVGIDIVVRPPA